MKIFNFFEKILILKFFENFEILNFKTKFFFCCNFRILKIGKPRPERVLIFPDRQTWGSAGVNFRH
jgi:hypothetical protein